MKRIFRLGLGLSIIASILTPVNSSAISTNPTAVCSGATCKITFAYTGDYYTWSAPYTTTYTIELWGAAGGDITDYYPVTGGNGGYVSGTVSITSGEVLNIYPGGKGANRQGNHVYGACENVAGGWNGGGPTKTQGNGTPGGGASDVRIGGTALSNRVAVAGGGGGGGWTYAKGGAGGGLTGANGTNINGSGTGAYGGTQSAGGAVGAGSACGGKSAGSLGQGGTGNGNAAGGGGGGGGYYGGGGGGYSDGGGGGSSFVGTLGNVTNTRGDATMPNPSGGTMTGNAGNGVVRITYDNSPIPTTFTTTEPTRSNTSSAISYSLTFSQNVNSVADADFSNAGTATGCVFSISGASGTSFTLTVSSCSEGTLIPKVTANSVYGTVTSQNGPSSDALTTTPITIDRTAPTISSVTAPANATYIPGNVPAFTVTFSESVTVSGTPRLVLTVGTSTEYATFLNFSDSKTATFRYTVGLDPLELDSDGISINTTLDLNGGAIADLATNAIVDRTFTAPILTSVFVAQPAAAPTIDSITATSGTLAIYFTAGAARGSTTTNYQYSANNGAWTNRPTGTTASPITLTGLTNGTGYTIRIRAVTNAGNSDTSTAVTETPTAITVTGDATLTLTYGSSASTGSYSATGGTNTYTWSLGSSISGVTLSGTTVTAANTLGAGIYTQTVRATDGNSQVGSKTLTITVNKASTSISISLPNSASNAALGGAVTITATVPRAGVVNFKLGGSTISGCGSAAAASTTATCSWTPGALGSISLTAVFTPTDSSNFETATSTTLTITVVNGVSTVSLQLAGGVTEVPKGQTINIIAAIDQAGKVSFYVDGKRLPGCFNKTFSAGNATCAWKPAAQKTVTIRATLDPTNSVYNNSESTLQALVTRRSGRR
jgi:hypothetical protein